MSDSQVPLSALATLAQICAKTYARRTFQENQQMISLLEQVRIFHKYISRQEDRRSLIESAAPYVKYHYYPKGVAICHEGDQGQMFGVIIKGRAIEYTAKTKSELETVDKKELMKGDYWKAYWDYLELRDFSKKFKKFAYEGASAERIASILLNKSKRFETCSSMVSSGQFAGRSHSMRSIEMIIDNILNHPFEIIRGYEHDHDLTYEEKLLLLNHNVAVKSYFNKGLPTHKVFRELKPEDFISKVALAIDHPAERTIIAAEDVHTLTIKAEDFLSFFEYVSNFIERKNFIQTALPSLERNVAMKLCAQLEERSFVNFENVYKKGEYSDAIYFIKKGSVQLIVDNKEEKTRKELGLPSNIHAQENKAPKPSEIFVICNLNEGHVFGENDVMARRGRRYRAMCSSDHLITYVLKREVIFYSIFRLNLSKGVL